MQVESVAFIAGRRDILYTLFFIISCIQYIKYIDTKEKKYYYYTLSFFILSVLSKGQAVSLPITLILLDFFRNKKLFHRKAVIEKIPFFIIALFFGIVAFQVKNVTVDYKVTPEVINAIPLYERITLACFGFITYVIKLIIPYNLSLIYPYPIKNNEVLHIEYYLYPLLLILLSIIVYKLYKNGNKNVIWGTLFFTINIFMVLQIIPNSYGIVNEHYVYLPSIGIFFIIASVFNYLNEHKKALKNKLIFILSIYFIFLSVNTYSRSKVWKDTITLFSDVIKKHPQDPLAYVVRGTAQNDKKNYTSAIQDFNHAIKLHPDYPLAYLNRGLSYYYLKEYDKASFDMNNAVKLSPENALAYNNRGMLKNAIKNYTSAPDFDYASP